MTNQAGENGGLQANGISEKNAHGVLAGTPENPNKKGPDTARESGIRTFLRDLRHDSEYRMRVIHTAFVVWMFITLGWNVSVVGGTFPDLRLIINKDLETASWLFTVGSLGYLTGAFVGGILYDRVNRLLILVGVTSLNAVSITAFPWCSTFPTMLAINFINGLFTGGIDVGGNSHIASIWGRRAAPFMQTIHFGFSFGGIISPLTAEPFLSQKSCAIPGGNFSDVITTSSPDNNTSDVFTTSSPNNSSFDVIATSSPDNNSTTVSASCHEVYGETHIHYAYLIAGIVSLSATVPFLTLYFLSSRHKTYIDTPYAIELDNIKKKESATGLPEISRSMKVTFVTLLMLLISVYACTEGRFSSLLTTFLADHLDWSTSDGLHVTSLFWGTFAAGRFLGILVTRFLKTPTMVLCYLIALTLSFVLMLMAAIFDVRGLVWACAALAGLSMSVIFPSIFTWTAESILLVTGKISAVYLVGVSAFNMLLPLLFGYLMDNFTQMYFVYLLEIQCVIALALYVIIRILIKLYVDPLRKSVL